MTRGAQALQLTGVGRNPEAWWDPSLGARIGALLVVAIGLAVHVHGKQS